MNIESHDHNDTWIGEVISRVLRRNRMSNVITVANNVTLKGIINRTFLEMMFFLRITNPQCSSFLDYSEGMEKACIELINVGQ